MPKIEKLYGVPGMKKGVRKEYQPHPRQPAAFKPGTLPQQTGGHKGRKKGGGKKKKTQAERDAEKATKEAARAEAKWNKEIAAKNLRTYKKKVSDKKKAEKQAERDAKKVAKKAEQAQKKAAREAANVAKKQARSQAKAQKQATSAQVKQQKADAKAKLKADAQVKKAQVKASQLAIKKAALLQKAAAKLAAKVQNADLKARIKEVHAAAAAAARGHKQSISTVSRALKSAGDLRKSSGHSILSEIYLGEEHRKFTLWRTLTFQEKKVDWQELNDYFNEEVGNIKSELTSLIRADLTTNINRLYNRLKAGDIAGIASIALVSANKLNDLLNKHIKNNFEKGKAMAAKELQKPKPATPTKTTQVMNLNSSMIAEKMATDIDLAGKQKASDGFLKGAALTGIISSVMDAASGTASKMIVNAAGNVAGENINKGRQLVFATYQPMIQAVQRSEVLDDRTCDMCLSLDETTLMADDPFAQLDEVHTNCRGIWVPILTTEDLPPADDIGLDGDVADSFDTIGGVPTVNAFTQLKAPLDDLSKDAQAEVDRRLQSADDEED